tara:strand:+ start:21447 stop:21779 length:333 start_codon:yes stop_codon:yes gene_type:complete
MNQAQRNQGWPDDVRGAIKTAFANLRKKGYFARMNYMCCSGCAGAAMPENTKNYVFFHNQCNEQLVDEGRVYLYWAGDGAEIVDELHNQNLIINWNGKDYEAIFVEGVWV